MCLQRTMDATMMNKKIIVFSPHPDDETVGCGGTIAKKISEGYDVTIVVMTDGKHAFSKLFGITSNPSPDELKTIRKEELKRATKILGVPEENLIFLDFEDYKLKENLYKAEKEVCQMLSRFRPVEVYFPYRNDSHPDHRVTNQIARRCIKNLGLSTLKFEYSVAQKYSRVALVMDRTLKRFRGNRLQIDISPFAILKEKALGEFRSEITVFSNKQTRPIVTNSRRHLRNKETFYVFK